MSITIKLSNDNTISIRRDGKGQIVFELFDAEHNLVASKTEEHEAFVLATKLLGA